MAKVALNKQAPDFSLTDYTGRKTSLSDFKTQKNVLLVFNRGFTWPFCRAHMAQLRQSYNQFRERDTEVVVVGPEDAEAFRKYFAEKDLPFIGLPDPKHSVLRLYGQEISLFKLGRMPAQVLVDKAGIARFVHYGNDMTDIPPAEEMIALIDQLNTEQMLVQ